MSVADPAEISALKASIGNVLEQLLQLPDVCILDDPVDVGLRHHIPIQALCLRLERECHSSLSCYLLSNY